MRVALTVYDDILMGKYDNAYSIESGIAEPFGPCECPEYILNMQVIDSSVRVKART
jgi:hypothetical protein